MPTCNPSQVPNLFPKDELGPLLDEVRNMGRVSRQMRTMDPIRNKPDNHPLRYTPSTGQPVSRT